MPAELVETTLLFGVLFLPSYFAQSAEFDQSVLYSNSYNISYVIGVIPQVLFLFFVATRGNDAEAFGIRSIAPRDLVFIFLTIGGLAIIALPVIAANGTIEGMVSPSHSRSIGLVTSLLMVVSALATGYREELFFRSILYIRIKRHGLGTPAAAIASSSLFAAGHLYQGIGAFGGAFAMGLFLVWVFEKRRAIHVIALGHAGYNAIMLLIAAP